ncbi:MAG: HAD-IIA family hydrolase [Brachybacterium sp.]|nr:HAD-IIA family hydrolase [Brachybacterium sp.]
MIRRPDASLLVRYDALLLDLDGTVMHGGAPIPGAADGIRTARAAGAGIAFVTNNASRTPQQVVEHLAGVDVEAAVEEIVTSPQIAAGLLADQLENAAEVLVIGSDGLAEEIARVDLSPVREAGSGVAAVVQGFSPDLDWARLAEAAYALADPAVRWMATNTDATLPTERGMAPGNGSLVAAVAHATGRTPDVAGKPQPGMFHGAAERLASRRPLVVGDRLDTDIEGAGRAEMDSLLVLTGVNSVLDALHAEPLQRPTWIQADMTTLDRGVTDIAVHGTDARCGRASARFQDGDIHLDGDPDSLQSIHAALALVRRHAPDNAWTGTLRTREGDSVTTVRGR